MALLVKRGLTKKFDFKSNSDWDWQFYLKGIWLAHLEAAQCAVLEISIMHGISCPRSCCSGRSHVVEVRKKK
jgi:hypothetical protein